MNKFEINEFDFNSYIQNNSTNSTIFSSLENVYDGGNVFESCNCGDKILIYGDFTKINDENIETIAYWDGIIPFFFFLFFILFILFF